MQTGGASAAEPAPRPPSDLWSRALSPLPWAVSLLVLAWAALYALRRYLR